MVDISKLTKAEKRVLYDQLAFELKASDDLTPEDQTMWSNICDALELTSRAPLSRFADHYGKKKYREACAQIRDYVDAACSPKLRKPVREAVTVVALRCLVNHLKQRSIPHTPTVLLNSTMVLEYAVGQRFPGYKEARMLDRIATSRSE